MASGGKVVVTIGTKDDTRRGLKKVERNFKDSTAAAQKFGVVSAAVFTALAAAIGKAVNAFADFDNRIREITTLLTELDESTVQQLEDNILTLAVSTGQAVEDMAKANYDAISAGFNDAGESALLLEQSARLAVGGVSDVAATTDVLTSILNSYGQSAASAAKFSDELFTIVRLGKTTIDELTSGLGRAVAIAPQLSVSFQDLGAAVATLTAAGQSTDQVVTSLTQVLSKLLSPTDALEKRLAELGFTSGRAAVEALGFAETLNQVAAGAEEAELAEFFSDVRAIRAVLPLAGVQAEKFAKNVREMGEAAGAADEAFKRVSEGIGFRFNQINTLLQTALISAGDAFLPLIEAMVGIDGELGKIGERREEIISFFEDTKAVVQGFVDVMTFLREIAQEPLIITILTQFDPDLEFIKNAFSVESLLGSRPELNIPVRIDLPDDEIQKLIGRVAKTMEDIEEAADVDFFAEDLFSDLEQGVEKLAKAEQTANENAVKLRNELTQLGALSSILDQPLDSFNELQSQIDNVTKQILRLQIQAQSEVALLGIADDKTLENIRQVSNLLNVITQQANNLRQAALTEKLSENFIELEKRANNIPLALEKIPDAVEGVQINPDDIIPPTAFEELEAGFRSRIIPLAFEISDTIADAFIDAFGIANSAFGNLVASILKQATSLATRLGALSLVSLIPGVGSFASLVRLAFAEGGIVPNIQGFADGGIVKNIPQMEGFQSGGIKSTDTIPAALTPGEAVIPAQSTENNREIIDRLIASPSPLQSTIAPVQQSSNNINVAFNGFDELSAQRILNSPEFQNTFADIINNGELKVEIEGRQLEVIK